MDRSRANRGSSDGNISNQQTFLFSNEVVLWKMKKPSQSLPSRRLSVPSKNSLPQFLPLFK